MKTLRFFTAIIFYTASLVNAAPKIDTYGQLPQTRSWAISPGGELVSFIYRHKDIDKFVVRNLETGEVLLVAEPNAFKARSIDFATDNYVILRGAETRKIFGLGGRPREFSGAIAYNLAEKKDKLLLRGTKKIHPGQTRVGRIIGLSPESITAYMPAFSYGSNPQYNLYGVSLESGRGYKHASGKNATVDWFVTSTGQVLAREDFINDKNLHQLWSKLDGKWKKVYEKETDIPLINVLAVGDDGKSLLFEDKNKNQNQGGRYSAIYALSLEDGNITGPLYSQDDAEVDDLLLDINRRLIAVVFSGFKPTYQFVDPSMTKLYSRIEQSYPNSSIYFESISIDKKSVIVFVTGPEAPGSYFLYRKDTDKLALLGSQYDVESIAPIKAIRYSARDGLKIPALLTLPPEMDEHKNLPLIVLPHGGPEAYDHIRFDWMAQYFAAKGYAVFQPNYRGSTGFGYAFRNAGRGRWGREMQDDITDGIQELIDSGYVDATRICIMGASYGGYSALAGGAFTPELYRCVVSINGISDLPDMLNAKKHRYGSDHWVIAYWQKLIGDGREEVEKLKQISPINFADQFQAPVLLVHGDDDTNVQIDQSKDMFKALKKSGKTVSFVTLKKEDHWLSSNHTRLQLLKEVDHFLEQYNPAK